MAEPDEKKFSVVGKITLTSIVIYCITLTALESLVIYFHSAFVSNFILSLKGTGISISDLIYHGIFIVSLLFQVILCMNALYRRNSIQLGALVLFNILSLAYAVVQIYQHIILEEEGTESAKYKPNIFPTAEEAKNYFVSKMRPIEYTIAALVFVFSVYLGILSLKLMKEFGWKNYRLYTADVNVRNAFVSLTILQTLIKLDMFFITSYGVQLTPSKLIGYSDSMLETALIFIVGFILLVMAWYSVIKEEKYILLMVINICFVSLGYMVYRIYKISISRNDDDDPYKFTRKLLTFTLCVAFLLVSVTVYYGIVCFNNMSKGRYVYSVYGRPGEKIDDPFVDKRRSAAYLHRSSTAVSLD